MIGAAMAGPLAVFGATVAARYFTGKGTTSASPISMTGAPPRDERLERCRCYADISLARRFRFLARLPQVSIEHQRRFPGRDRSTK